MSDLTSGKGAPRGIWGKLSLVEQIITFQTLPTVLKSNKININKAIHLRTYYNQDPKK